MRSLYKKPSKTVFIYVLQQARMTVCDEHSSLLRLGIDWGCKTFTFVCFSVDSSWFGLIELLLFSKTYLKGGLALSWQPGACIIKLITVVIYEFL